MEIDVTKNFDFLQENWDSHDIFVMEGSTRSGKTIAIVQWLVLQAINNPGITIRGYRHDSTTHDKGAVHDMDFVLGPGMMDLGNHYKKNATLKTYTFFNDSTISFSATSDVQKLHGPGADITWLNEVMEISHAAYKQIAFRTRGKIIMDFNPSYNRHWVFDSITSRSEGVAKNRSTYKDNKFLSKQQIFEIESTDPSNPDNVRARTADAWYWSVYGLGKRGVIKGAVFDNWEVHDPEIHGEWPTRSVSERHGFGLDFGFQVSRSAITENMVHNRALYVRERLYKVNYLTLKNITQPGLPSIQGHLEEMEEAKTLLKNDLIVADSAAPQDISSLMNYGYNIIPVSKSKGNDKSSKLNGINIMKKFKIIIHPDSQNLQLEFEHYKWREQNYKDGETQLLPEPIKKDDDLIDTVRYWSMMNLTGNLADFGPTVQVTEKNFSYKREVINKSRDRIIR